MTINRSVLQISGSTRTLRTSSASLRAPSCLSGSLPLREPRWGLQIVCKVLWVNFLKIRVNQSYNSREPRWVLKISEWCFTNMQVNQLY